MTRRAPVPPVFSTPIRVYYEDTDAGGVVYYANYLKFMERARSEWLRRLGFEQDELARDPGVLFAVRTAKLEFLKPARFNDLLEATVEIRERGRASLTFRQQIRRDAESANGTHQITGRASAASRDSFSSRGPRLGHIGEVLCEGEVRVACLEAKSFAPCPIPPTILSRLDAGAQT